MFGQIDIKKLESTISLIVVPSDLDLCPSHGAGKVMRSKKLSFTGILFNSRREIARSAGENVRNQDVRPS